MDPLPPPLIFVLLLTCDSQDFSHFGESSFWPSHQRASHFAIVGVAAALDVRGGTIQSARIALTGASSHALRLTAVEQALAGKPLSTISIEAAARAEVNAADA